MSSWFVGGLVYAVADLWVSTTQAAIDVAFPQSDPKARENSVIAKCVNAAIMTIIIIVFIYFYNKAQKLELQTAVGALNDAIQKVKAQPLKIKP